MQNELDPETQVSSSGPWAFLRRNRLLIVILIVLVVGGGWFLHRTKQQNAANTRPNFAAAFGNAVAVSVATVQSGDIVVRIPGLGTVTPLTTVTVKAQVSGILQKVNFKEGQMVRKGELLAVIDPRPFEASLAQAKANLARDEALLADAQLNMKRYEDLIKEDSVSQQQVDTQRSTVGQDEGSVASDKAQVKTAELNLGYTQITSPIDGRVGLRQVDPGNYVTPGDANGVAVVTQLHPISVLFTVPEDNVPNIMRQLKAGATLAVEATGRANSEHLADGYLANTDNVIDTTTGTLKLRAEFDNSDQALFPGQFVNVSLVVTTLKNQIVIPAAAVRRGAPNGVQSAFVYLVNANNTVSVRPVELGVVDGETQAVKSGVELNDVVVTDGGDRLRDGAAVQLPEATAAAVAKARAQAQAERKNESRFPNARFRRRNGQGGPPGGFGGRPPGGFGGGFGGGRPPGGGPP
ncbi:MAG TPA: efflux RND transporter periplasmic adaptor subunit [Steroidobacteraceae bacterium]|nr:efflux RND transporter periplasmic adaptor subunit [Steroidobacteraceae bacterium]